jgi:N6-L-threonylcarbamoyladenine synthase
VSELLTLALETSCDETSAAVLHGERELLGHVILSQDIHRLYGGVVPELASRAHLRTIDDVVAAALGEAGVALADVGLFGVTAGPGLIGALLVGVTMARAIAAARGLPLVAVNHLEGHALTATLTDATPFPYLLLLVSGGHTQLVAVEGVGRYRRLGSTVDDALGEAFDKTAKLLGLPYPGGPSVEVAARKGGAARFDLPRPLKGAAGCDFSFSGLKTAVRAEAQRAAPLTKDAVRDLCAAFQAAVCDVLEDRTARAIDAFMDKVGSPPQALVVAGGVAANRAIRSRLLALCERQGLPLVAPPPELCTDNAAMIAWAGALRLAHGLPSDADMPARARWPLDPDAEPLIGAGRLGARV